MNRVGLPPEIVEHLSPLAAGTAGFMHLVPHSDGGCQFEIHAGGMSVEIEISSAGRIVSVCSGPSHT